MALSWRAVVLAALGAIPAMFDPAWRTVGLWLLLVVAVCGLDVTLAASPRRVQVTRQPPVSVRLTQTATSTLRLANPGPRRLRGLMRDAWQPSAGATPARHRVDIPPGTSRRFTTIVRPTRRGRRQADRVTIRSFGPLGFAARQASHQVPASVLVLPEFASRKHLPSRLARLRELDGRTAVQIRGAGTEFDSLREYVIGDDVRSIDWRATARRGDVVVRTWRPERDRRVLVVVDTSRTSAARIGDLPRLDASIEATLLLAALASHAGDRVDVLAMDRQVRARLTGESGPGLMASLATTLADVSPHLVETSWPRVSSQVLELASRRCLVVLLTSVDTGATETGLIPAVAALAGRHMVVVAAVRDAEVEALRVTRETTQDVFDAAAAERTELERSAVLASLRQLGAQVVDELPDQLAPALADTYLALKAAGRL